MFRKNRVPINIRRNKIIKIEDFRFSVDGRVIENAFEVTAEMERICKEYGSPSLWTRFVADPVLNWWYMNVTINFIRDGQ